MDHESFDTFARLFGTAGSRRAALGALLGAGALGVAEAAAAKNRKKRRNGKKGKGTVSAQAMCPPPDHGVNRNNCNYTGDDFSGQQIHSSSYKNTIFRNAELVETIMHSSNYRDANFRGANLCGADLSSSNLRNADFRGFGLLGRPTDLTLADLSSSSCGGLGTNGRTIFCGTIDCNGNVRNDDCPGGVPSDFCCTPCGAGEDCVDNQCVCTQSCNFAPPCGAPGCAAITTVAGGACFCSSALGQPCASFDTCPNGDEDCEPGFACVLDCCPQPVCIPPCGVAARSAARARSDDSGPRLSGG